MSTPRALASRSGRSSSADEICRMWMRAPVHSARIAARLTASTATTAGRDAMCASGSMRPACRRRAAGEILLVRIAGVAEMHMIVDHAGQHVQPPRVERLCRLRHDGIIADRDDAAVFDRDARLDDAVGADDLA